MNLVLKTLTLSLMMIFISRINHPRDMLQNANRPCRTNQKHRKASAKTVTKGHQKVSWRGSQVILGVFFSFAKLEDEKN